MQNQNLWNWFLVKIGQNTKPIALLFGQNWPILSTFHCKIKSLWKFLGQFWAKYQAYSLDFWPKLAKNQFQSTLDLGKSKCFEIDFWPKLAKKYQAYSLTFWPKLAILSTFHCKIKIFEIDFWSKLGKILSL